MDKDMNIFKSLKRNFKNIFVGSHRGDDFKLEPLPERYKNNDPNDWFENPLDKMPVATDNDNYSSRHESTPDFEKDAEEIVTMHEKMYRIATAKYNPFAAGGSESIHDFEGGSENVR
tara:strand:- start:83 stop:433 length:351 start_codon:yes stop_codon:yes gene_type:complete